MKLGPLMAKRSAWMNMCLPDGGVWDTCHFLRPNTSQLKQTFRETREPIRGIRSSPALPLHRGRQSGTDGTYENTNLELRSDKEQEKWV